MPRVIGDRDILATQLNVQVIPLVSDHERYARQSFICKNVTCLLSCTPVRYPKAALFINSGSVYTDHTVCQTTTQRLQKKLRLKFNHEYRKKKKTGMG